ncbi:MAG: single-stranded-DNA-specific exonuclease RecJ [Alphaproteobacteria bacterium]|nr:single-stranded-DNA-specific exonuclease RecJ [Alphaproteobacteria bacterium]MBU0796614.1 single-stranded-DNA-specific exonuclease RecJ [Alphaproteobacteria bacterium]MBU0886501.1 single-stranded-DNA-specific exonuclease RecJ [Alphaproteobacteria bacterium]MBU1814089.1 single-stranded-DNA-specific exonuclease RecJ [Alphaproteobacteria bacterium]
MTRDSADASAFLDVERSLTGRRWISRGQGSAASGAEAERVGLALSQRLGLPEILGRVLAARGIGLEEAEGFLTPTLRAALPDPSHLKDMDAAATRIARAVTSGEIIAIFGDYDVDGATSTALLRRFLEAVGGKPRVYIPDRMTEGYGPNAPALLGLKRDGAAICITVDCGITAFAALETASEAGLEMVVIDHHVAEPTLPRAVAVVNPNRLDDDSPHGALAAVGVAFLLVVAVNRALRQAGWYKQQPEPDLLQWLDLVALGTVCDVVPLTGLNRCLVAQGLKVMGQRRNIGMAALADVARMDEAPTAYHLGFLLGPRVNAGGRVGRADLGTRLLSTQDAQEAAALAQELDGFNAERKQIEQGVQDEAMTQVEAHADGPLLVAVGEGWHPGVIGIVAGRLKERFHRPALVIAFDENGIGKGSGRSIAGFALGPAVIAAHQAGLLINGGGHAMAAGFTVERGKLAAFRDFLSERAASWLQGGGQAVPVLSIDGALRPGGATLDLLEVLGRVGPFGVGNPEPRFVFPAARIVAADVVGDSHVRCQIADSDGRRLKAIAFRALETPLGTGLLQARSTPLHIAGHLRIDRWQGAEKVQLLIDDAAIAL